MSTYPGEDPQAQQGQQPADQAPSEPTTEPTQPVGYWEQQATEQAQQGQSAQDPYGQAPYSPYSSGPPQQYGGSPYAAPAGAQPGWYPPQAGQPAYPPPPGPGAYGGGYSPPQRDHPQATLSLVLGLVGLIGAMMCGLPLVISPFAWVIGRGALKEIEASQGRLGGDGLARAGMIMGIIGTTLLILAIVAVVLFVVSQIVGGSSASTTGSSI